jgi:hypothetical protein
VTENLYRLRLQIDINIGKLDTAATNVTAGYQVAANKHSATTAGISYTLA